MVRLSRLSCVAIAMLIGFAMPAAGDAKAPPTAAAQSLAIAEAANPSLVRVEYTLQFDKGEPPQSLGWAQRCPTCGGYHGSGSSEELVTQERPMEIGGFLVAADTVLIRDPLIHPRFVKSLAVRFGDKTVPATMKAVLKDRSGVLLTLEKPLDGAKPLAFDAAIKGPYFAVTYAQGSADWAVKVEPVGGALVVTTSNRRYHVAPSFSLITDGKGKPVGLAMKEELPADGSWKGSPSDWPVYSAAEIASLQQKLDKTIAAGLPQVTLNFRSPRATDNDSMGMGMRMRGDDENATVRHATGVLLDEKSVLVLIDLKAKQTARLEKIRVQAGGESVDAKFARTLSDYGALVVTLDKPLKGAVRPADTADVQKLKDVMLPTCEVLLQGDQRTQHLSHRRIAGFNVGFQRQHVPEMPSGDKSLFLFNEAGELVALPIARRQKGVDDDRYSYRSERNAATTLVGYVWPAATGDAATYADANNVPLTEAQENRIAWLGVELQPLTPDLARENGVSNQTTDGQTGGLVTYVYPDSPAAKAGIEAGQIILRVHAAGVPKPIDIRVEQSGYGDQPYPWDRFDTLPEHYFDRIPRPWPAVENSFTRALTDLGFGKKFDLEVASDGKVQRKTFDVKEGPASFDSAEKLKFDPLGVTLKEMTFEVRRYFQVPEGQPGLIIGKIEIGSRASTSGLKPYELVTHVNDQPITTLKEFEEKTKGQESLRLSIKRMTKSRQVNITLTGKAPATKPATPEE